MSHQVNEWVGDLTSFNHGGPLTVIQSIGQTVKQKMADTKEGQKDDKKVGENYTRGSHQASHVIRW